MPIENKTVEGTGITKKSNVDQQVEWLDEVIDLLKAFKEEVRNKEISIEGGYFDQSINPPLKDEIVCDELRMSIDFQKTSKVK